MNFTPKTTSPDKIEADLLILFSFENEPISEYAQSLLPAIKSLPDILKKEQFTGKTGQSVSIYTQPLISSYKVLFMGVGKEEKISLASIQKSIALATRKAKVIKSKKIAFLFPEKWFKKFSTEVIGQDAVEAVMLGGYQFTRYKSEEFQKEQTIIEEVYFLARANRLDGIEKGKEQGYILAQATIFARDLVNEPSAVSTPTHLSRVAQDIAKKSNGAVKVKIMEKEEVQKLGMNAFLGVSQGSEEPPKFITLTYKSAHPKKKVVIVGKGITFDTGGLSLKPPEHMETMKLDMAGAAAVLGIFSTLAQLKPNGEVIGVIAACENMPSGKAVKPGDILRAMNGKTIEVLNTDAEGRLTFADALSFAVLQKPDAIIDLATLTGACMVALGEQIAGLWGNNQTLIDEVIQSAKKAGESVWQMPLESEYKPLIKSHIADVKNIQTGRYGGAITAALFLEEFVDNRPWVHLDIAGPAYEERGSALVARGGSGFGVRTVLQYLLSLS